VLAGTWHGNRKRLAAEARPIPHVMGSRFERPPTATERVMTNRTNESLKEVKIFAKEDTIWGIPSKLFIGSGVMTVAMLTQIPIVFALAIGGLLFGVLFAIYNDDPRALQAWQRSMGRPVRWTANPTKARRVQMVPFKD
jgi:hypothetical protein